MRITITNVFGHGNRGDAALVSVLYESLRSVFPEAEIHGITNNPQQEKDHVPGVIWHQAPGHAPPGPWQRPLNALFFVLYMALALLHLPSGLFSFLPRKQTSGVRAIRTSDLVVSCPGGFLLDINLHFFMDVLQLQLAVSSGTPVLIAPQTIGPIRNQVSRQWVARILAQASTVFVREEISRRLLAEEMGLTNVVLFPDLAFFHRDRDESEGERVIREHGLTPSEFVAVSALDWQFPGNSSRSVAQAHYEKRLAAAIREVQEELGVEALLINQVSTDLPACRRVAAQCNPPAKVDEEDRPPEVLRAIFAQASGVIASRFHSCIFAMLENVPVVAISYTYKTDGIMEMLGRTDDVFNINTFSPERVAAQAIAQIRGVVNRRAIEPMISESSRSWEYNLRKAATQKVSLASAEKSES